MFLLFQLKFELPIEIALAFVLQQRERKEKVFQLFATNPGDCYVFQVFQCQWPTIELC